MIRKPGKKILKLIDLLKEAGYTVLDTGIIVTRGYWIKQDACRWAAWTTDKDGYRHDLMSWDTVTDCVRYGIEVKLENDGYPWYRPETNVYARRKK